MATIQYKTVKINDPYNPTQITLEVQAKEEKNEKKDINHTYDIHK